MSVSLTGRKCQLVLRVKRNIVIRRAPGKPREGRLTLAHGVRRVALGKGGVAALKREGDGATPLGRFPIRQVLYRLDRMKRPRTPFPVRAIRADDCWCEDPADRNYNKLVKVSPNSSADRLIRDDHLYDLIFVLGHNDRPRVRRGDAAAPSSCISRGPTTRRPQAASRCRGTIC